MPRFVILEHDHPHLHWDLMLEQEGVLRTWRLAAPPGQPQTAAEPLVDHRLDYLGYEGPVSGNRGTVRRWDEGSYDVEEERPGWLLLWFEGRRLQGRAVLEGSGITWSFRREGSILSQSDPGDSGSGTGEDSQEQPPDEPLPAP